MAWEGQNLVHGNDEGGRALAYWQNIYFRPSKISLFSGIYDC